MASNEKETFTIQVTMQTRWIPHFLGMLNYMQKLGSWGSSREVSIYADGDGDFRPKFAISQEIRDKYPENLGIEKGHPGSGDRHWDAG